MPAALVIGSVALYILRTSIPSRAGEAQFIVMVDDAASGATIGRTGSITGVSVLGPIENEISSRLAHAVVTELSTGRRQGRPASDDHR